MADAAEEVEVLEMVTVSKGTGEVQVLRPGELQEQAQFVLPPGMEAGDLPGKKAAVLSQLGGNEPIRVHFLLQRRQETRQGAG